MPIRKALLYALLPLFLNPRLVILFFFFFLTLRYTPLFSTIVWLSKIKLLTDLNSQRA